MKALASILPKLQRDLRKDLRSGVEYDEENTIEEDAMKNVSSADKKPQKFKKPDGTMGTRMVSADPKKEEGKMDPVGQADADIDNDGDVDKSDKYLHNRRKAIKKAITKKKDPQGENGETATMNPKKESTIRSKLLSILEGDRAKHYKGAAEAEEMENKYKGAGAKKMAQDHKGPTVDIEKQSHDDASKAGRAVKSKAKARSGSDAVNSGDQNIVNPVKDTTKAGKGDPTVKESFQNTYSAYASMYEKKIDENYGITQDAKAHAQKNGENYDGDVSVQHRYDAYHYKKNGYTHFEPGSYGTRRYTKGSTGMNSRKIEPSHHSLSLIHI